MMARASGPSTGMPTGAAPTARENDCVALGLTPFVAVIVSGKDVELEATAGVPEMVAVPSSLSTKDTPWGSAPAIEIVGTGNPVVVTVKLPATPGVNATVAGLVIVGAAGAA